MQLKKKYHFWTVFFMGIAATVGSSILISFGQVSFQAHFDPFLLIIAFVLGGIFVLPEAMLMAETATSFPTSGTAYMWLKRAGWNGLSFWFGWILVLFVSATAVATACLAFGNIFGSLFDITDPWLCKVFGIALLFLLFGLQTVLKNASGYTQIVFAVLKSLPIAFVLIIALLYGTTANIPTTISANFPQLILSTYLLLPATAMTMFAYSGVESVTYITEEIYEPKKTVPRALIFGILGIIVLYLILSIALLAINVPSKWADDTGNFSNVWFWAMFNNPSVPKVLPYIFSGLTILLFIGSINAFLLYQSRLIFKMSEEKDLFKIFQKTTKRTNMPWTSMLLLVFLSLTYILWNELYSVTNYFVLAVSVLKIIMLVNMVYLRLKNKDYKKMYGNILFWILVVLSLFGAIVGLFGSGLAMYYYATKMNNMWLFWNCLIVVAILASGYPVYYFKKIVENKSNDKKKKSIKKPEFIK